MRPTGILETALYCDDLAAARAFYGGVLGLEIVAEADGRHLFFRCGDGVLLIFNPAATSTPPPADALPVPPHGARGPGHACFSASAAEITRWRAILENAGVAIEADFQWPSGKGRSIYFRDPAGNSLEFANPEIWRP